MLRRQREAHRHLVLRAAAVDRRHVLAREPHAHGLDDVLRRDTGERRLVLEHAHHELRRVVVDAVVDGDDVGRGGERAAHLFRQGHLPGVVGAVDLGHDRRQHRRSGRHLHHLDLRAMGRGDLLERRAHRLRDLVGLAVAMMLVDQVDLDVALRGQLAQVVLPHQAVEVDRARDAGVGLVVLHFRHDRDPGRHFAQHARRPLQRRAGRHVDDHLELRLVVERQHLQHHQLDRRERDCEHDRGTDADEQLQAIAPPLPADSGRPACGRTARRAGPPALSPPA